CVQGEIFGVGLDSW
nr:immunoglobulin heavy chain junction region [Macaca mulatta]MOX58912.1 immunoglobulin heavy chain junction region [Macaca mulatta]MOX59042.1 immunoglobulin heavy chain junction region [Macaca mulatta]MOX59112.1 immunoglobulin heavy chain junction region [Macaca mulatta]MOX59212.1 immunoglobulin heavy chain junction region [Macaca mulatta]